MRRGRMALVAAWLLILAGISDAAIVRDLAIDAPDLRITGAGYPGDWIASGDVNGDGIGDLVISDSWIRYDVYVVFGSSGHPPLRDINLEEGGFDLKIDGRSGFFGYPVVCADVNGDGIDDLIVSSPWAESMGGAVYVYFGSSQFPPAHVIPFEQADLIVSGGGECLRCGKNLRCWAAGDVNGDGFDDMLFCSGDLGCAGTVYCIYGSATPHPSYCPEFDADLAIRGKNTVSGPGHSDDFGESMCTADYNRDGIEDIIAAAPGADGTSRSEAGDGRIYGIFGSRGFPPRHVIDLNYEKADLEIIGSASADRYATEVAAADFNGDGGGDICVHHEVGAGSSSMLLFHSPESVTVPRTIDAASCAPDLLIHGPGWYWGQTAGDFNGDSHVDCISKAQDQGYGNERVIVSSGYPPRPAGSTLDLSEDPPAFEVRRSWSTWGWLDALCAADLNGDGICDIAVSSWLEEGVYVFFGKDDADWDDLDAYREQAIGTDPQSSDTDGDGIADAAEVGFDGDMGYFPYDPVTGQGTDLNPTTADTDGDGWTDSLEIGYGTDPIDEGSCLKSIRVSFQSEDENPPPGFMADYGISYFEIYGWE